MLNETVLTPEEISPGQTLEQALLESGMIVTGIRGVSMKPMLDMKTDRIIVVPLTGKPKRGDVVLYRRGGSYVLHRVIEVLDGKYRIRGDNCTGDEFVGADALIGRLASVLRGNDCIEITEQYSEKYFKAAETTLPFRRMKAAARRAAGRLIRKCRIGSGTKTEH